MTFVIHRYLVLVRVLRSVVVVVGGGSPDGVVSGDGLVGGVDVVADVGFWIWLIVFVIVCCLLFGVSCVV